MQAQTQPPYKHWPYLLYPVCLNHVAGLRHDPPEACQSGSILPRRIRDAGSTLTSALDIPHAGPPDNNVIIDFSLPKKSLEGFH